MREDRAITDYEIEEQRRHDNCPVCQGEYDEDTEELYDRIEKLEIQIAELKKQLDEMKVKP